MLIHFTINSFRLCNCTLHCRHFSASRKFQIMQLNQTVTESASRSMPSDCYIIPKAISFFNDVCRNESSDDCVSIHIIADETNTRDEKEASSKHNLRLIFCVVFNPREFKSAFDDDKKNDKLRLSSSSSTIHFQRSRAAEIGSLFNRLLMIEEEKTNFHWVCLCWDCFFFIRVSTIFFPSSFCPTYHWPLDVYNLLFLSATRLVAVIFFFTFRKVEKSVFCV